jgi:glycosyltransferase involved in cell wall biosynthesis
MSEMIKYSVVIPCFNEAANLPILADGLRRLVTQRKNLEVILVDNGSDDGTGDKIDQICRELPRICTIRIEKNLGYGNGILKGFSKSQADVYLWTHADLQCDPLDIERAILTWEQKVEGAKFQLVKGKRKKRGLSARLISTFMSLVNLIVNQTWVSDINGQPNLVPAQALKRIPKLPLDSTFEMHILTYLKKTGQYEIRYIDVDFPNRVNGTGANEGIPDKISYIGKTIKQAISIRGGL